MNTLYQQLASESLAQTLAQLESRIKANPADADLRAAFVQFLCLAGNWSRALTQLKSWSALKPQAQPTVTLLEQVIRGEQLREEVLAGQRSPSMPEAQWPWLSALASSLGESGDEAHTLRTSALSDAEVAAGELVLQDGSRHPFDWLMDGDARFGPVCEAIVNGRYCWLPFSAIAEMRFQAPASVTDLVWRHTLVRLVDGHEQVCQIPARYPIDKETEDRFKLGRVTEWKALDDAGEHYLGHGQKVWLNDGAEYPLLAIETLTFNTDSAHE